MKIPFYLIFATLGAVSLGGCDGAGGKCDTADSSGCVADDTGGGSGSTLIEYYEFDNCAGSVCTWTVESGGQIGTVDLYLIETGDPTWDSSCGESISTGGGLVCGVWSEYHNAFNLSTDANSYGGDTKTLALSLVGSFEDQQSNSSTIFDMGSGTINNQLTWLIEISDANGSYADCVTNGDDPGYFNCGNVF